MLQRYKPVTSRYYLEWMQVTKRKVFGDSHPHPNSPLKNVGMLLQEEGREDEALQCLEQSLAIRKRVLGDHHHETARALCDLALLLQRQGRCIEAVTLHRESLAIRLVVHGENHPDTAQSYCFLGTLLYESNSLEESRHCLEQSLAIYTMTYGAEHLATGAVLTLLTKLLVEQRKVAEALSSRPTSPTSEDFIPPTSAPTIRTRESVAALSAAALGDGEGASAHTAAAGAFLVVSTDSQSSADSNIEEGRNFFKEGTNYGSTLGYAKSPIHTSTSSSFSRVTADSPSPSSAKSSNTVACAVVSTGVAENASARLLLKKEDTEKEGEVRRRALARAEEDASLKLARILQKEENDKEAVILRAKKKTRELRRDFG